MIRYIFYPNYMENKVLYLFHFLFKERKNKIGPDLYSFDIY